MINKQLMLSITDKYFEDVFAKNENASIPFSHQSVKKFIDYLHDELKKVENLAREVKEVRMKINNIETNAMLDKQRLENIDIITPKHSDKF